VRILHLTTFLQGGAGRAITDLALAQHAGGHQVRVMASATAPAGYGNYATYLDELSQAGVDTVLVDSTFERRHDANLAVVHAISRLYEAGAEPDVIHTHAAIPSLVALVFAGSRRGPIRIVQTMHGWGIAKTPEQAATDVAVLNLVDCVMVPSPAAAEALASLGVAPARMTVVPYGVGPSSVEPDERDQALLALMANRRRDGVLVVVCVGTFGARKQQSLLIDALASRRSDVFAVLVGDGDDGDLREAIDQRGLGDVVLLHGYSRAARRIAAAADVLVLPSRNEGLPLAVLEAFADGTVVVVSDIPELAELVEDGQTGFRFAAGRADVLADVLARLAALPTADRQAVAERAQACYRECFTVSAMVGAYWSAYRAPADVRAREHRRREAPAA
jgi:glycosyltransferase involved in cell wall biosynthesis